MADSFIFFGNEKEAKAMADETMWYVKYTDGEWKVNEVADMRSDNAWIRAVNGKGGVSVFGFVLATCENDAVMTACQILRDMYSEANRAPLPVVSY